LSVAASEVAFRMRREREAESVRRANQYVRAIQLYYRKFQRYPTTIEQLENTNNVRYLRRQYVDPLTGKADYRLIGVGQNKTTVKGFFGEPLARNRRSRPGSGGRDDVDRPVRSFGSHRFDGRKQLNRIGAPPV
jgi:type II secretory pathway pseudopilin PulG